MDMQSPSVNNKKSPVVQQDAAASSLCPLCLKQYDEPVATYCCHTRCCRLCLDMVMAHTRGICPYCQDIKVNMKKAKAARRGKTTSAAARALAALGGSDGMTTESESEQTEDTEDEFRSRNKMPLLAAAYAMSTMAAGSNVDPSALSPEFFDPGTSSRSSQRAKRTARKQGVRPKKKRRQNDAEGRRSGQRSKGPDVTTCPHAGCDKLFTKPSALRRHLRTHTGERPFGCTYPGCMLKFAERGNLKRHTRVHTGDKPYQCGHVGCGMRFARMGHLAQHTRTQHKESILFSALARKMMDTSESKVGNRASELPVEKLQIPVLKLRPGPKTRDAPVISTRFLYDDSLQWTGSKPPAARVLGTQRDSLPLPPAPEDSGKD